MPEGEAYERIEGRLVERGGSVESGEVGYQCFADDAAVRRADGPFVSADRPADQQPRGGYSRVAPDLVVEVVSRNDEAEAAEAKRVEWLAAGVRLVWVVFPRSGTVHSRHADGRSAIVAASGELSGEEVSPGFQVFGRGVVRGIADRPRAWAEGATLMSPRAVTTN